uniref:Tetrahydrofolate dehydrogenase/cyclohydrolase catalytic domain-containing protein n=1 Tax=Hippocampus comes TaxID=109280 RepID=A0A3Q2YEF3_HIPCM
RRSLFHDILPQVGLNVTQICLAKDSEDEIVEEVLKLNEDPRVHGIYLHLPPASLTSRVLDALKPEKDVDGITYLNTGRLVQGDLNKGFVPPVASAVMDLFSSASRCHKMAPPRYLTEK